MVLATAACLAVPAGAQAHHTAVPVVTLDYRNRILPAGQAGDGVRATLEDVGRRLRLTTDRTHDAVVLGYLGEPFLRFTVAGVAVNDGSPTAKSSQLATAPHVGTKGVVWRLLTGRTSLAWGDTRVWAPSDALHGRKRIAWRVPLVVDGRRTSISGELVRVPRPAAWPWVVIGLIPVALAFAAWRRRSWAWKGAAGLGAAAGVATLVALAGFAGAGLDVSAERWFELAAEGALVVIALAFVLRPPGRIVAIAALAAFAVVQAVSELDVFRRGVVASALPEPAVRLCIAVALGSGLGAAALVFLASSPSREGSRDRKRSSYVQRSRKEQA